MKDTGAMRTQNPYEPPGTRPSVTLPLDSRSAWSVRQLVAVFLRSIPIIVLLFFCWFLITLMSLEKGPSLGKLLSDSEMRVAWTLLGFTFIAIAGYVAWLFRR